MLDSRGIQEIIPHRPPFLLVDRILDVEPGKRAEGVKLFTISEPFFRGHFPGRPIVPGVLIVEALAQVGSVAILSLSENREKVAYFAGIDRFRFKRPVGPGDTVQLEVKLERLRGPIGKGFARASVDDELVAEGGLTFALVDRPNSLSGAEQSS